MYLKKRQLLQAMKQPLKMLSKQNSKPDTIKLLSFNVRGLSNFKKRTAIFSWCRKQKANLIFLQETHSSKEREAQWKKEWGAEILFSHGSTNARGVAVLVKNGILDQRSNLLNYFIILGKIYLWNCRKNKQIPLFLPFEDVVKRKYEIEKLIASQSILSLKHFQAKWNPVLNINPNFFVKE